MPATVGGFLSNKHQDKKMIDVDERNLENPQTFSWLDVTRNFCESSENWSFVSEDCSHHKQRIPDWLKLPFSLLNRVKFNLNLFILQDNFYRQNIDRILNINVKQPEVIFWYKKFLINGSGGPQRKNWESLQIRKEIWSENLDVTRRHRKSSNVQYPVYFL